MWGRKQQASDFSPSITLPPSQSPAAASGDQVYRQLFDGVRDVGIAVLDRLGVVARWNSAAAAITGYPAGEMIGESISRLHSPESIASQWPQHQLVTARRDGRFEDGGWLVRKDGARFWSNVLISPLYDDAGELSGFSHIFRDVSERRERETALRESEERLRLLIESVKEYAIFMLDPLGNVISWNSGAEKIKGYKAAEIVGQHFSRFYPPAAVAAGIPRHNLSLARERGRFEEEGWRVRKDGTMFWANVVVSAVYARDGDLLGFAKITRDMTERRRLEELERSSRMMSQFLAMLAHELRNPLAPMRNAVTLMQLEHTASPALKSARDIIDRQLTHVTRLVDDLLDIGRLTTGKIVLRLERVSVSDLVSRAVETARPLLDARRHSLQVDIPPRPVFVHADATRLSQVLQNLLVNAAKYTPEGGRVRVKVETAEGLVTISVKDNGRGLAREDRQRIFELFAQGDHGAPNESGLGVGLTLARSLTEMHGGRLDAESPGPGQGSTFIVQLPLADRADDAAADHPASDFQVLVVDDNRDSADSATAIIRLLGYQAECAYHGEAALEAARLRPPQMVLLDLAMPGIDGYTTLQRLRELPGMAHAFVVAMTGYGSRDDKQRTTTAGFNAHLTKPVELNVLVDLVNEARQLNERSL